MSPTGSAPAMRGARGTSLQSCQACSSHPPEMQVGCPAAVPLCLHQSVCFHRGPLTDVRSRLCRCHQSWPCLTCPFPGLAQAHQLLSACFLVPRSPYVAQPLTGSSYPLTVLGTASLFQTSHVTGQSNVWLMDVFSWFSNLNRTPLGMVRGLDIGCKLVLCLPAASTSWLLYQYWKPGPQGALAGVVRRDCERDYFICSFTP